jgi:hypothetical protein
MAFQQYPQKGGIPSGVTAARPSNPAEGDTYYNGQLGLLEIYSSGQWIPCSAPPAIPSISATDVGTGRAYDSGAFTYTFTAGVSGGSPYGYTAIGVLGATTYTSGATTATTGTLVVGNPGTYSISATAYNGFGISPASVPISLAVTTVPQAPTIGTATTSGSTTDVTVAWTFNSNGGKNLSAVTVTPYLNGTTAGTSQNAATTSATSMTFTGLTGGSAYTFKVKTTNANGVGLESSASNSITVPVLFSVDFLVLAGGGGGGAGGAGAGGLRSSVTASGRGTSPESAVSVSTGNNYTVTVGGGGAGVGAYAGTVGTVGNNSVFSTITSLGGGGGGASTNGGNGGCGGGATYSSATAEKGLGTAGQGFDGGSDTFDDPPYPAPGGGGTGQIGQNPPSGSTGGNGGNGTAVSITGSSVTYGGGGGGGVYGGGTGGTGGTGGGASGQSGQNGGTNLGGGGGGQAVGNNGGSGGKGLVILRWLTSVGTITVGAGLTADATGTDGSYSYKRITDGSGNVSWS